MGHPLATSRHARAYSSPFLRYLACACRSIPVCQRSITYASKLSRAQANRQSNPLSQSNLARLARTDAPQSAKLDAFVLHAFYGAQWNAFRAVSLRGEGVWTEAATSMSVTYSRKALSLSSQLRSRVPRLTLVRIRRRSTWSPYKTQLEVELVSSSPTTNSFRSLIFTLLPVLRASHLQCRHTLSYRPIRPFRSLSPRHISMFARPSPARICHCRRASIRTRVLRRGSVIWTSTWCVVASFACSHHAALDAHPSDYRRLSLYTTARP